MYHVGRYLYLADALEDLPRDVRAGAYNPLRYRYGADGGTLDPADRAQLLETIDASISMACSAMELLDGRRDRELLSNILYFGTPRRAPCSRGGNVPQGGKQEENMKDPYEVLGVPHGASEDEIKKGLPGACAEIPSR